MRATFELIADVATTLPTVLLEAFFAHIRALPPHEYDEKTVAFLKDYTMNAITNLKRARKQAEGGKMRGTGVSGMFRGGKKPDDPLYDDDRYYDP